MVFVVIQRRHKVPTFLFSRSGSLFLAYYSKTKNMQIIIKSQKHFLQ